MNKKIVLLILSLAIMVSFFTIQQLQAKDQFVMDVLDIGQGDSILLTFPNHYQILIDGGPSDQVLEELRLSMPLADHHIDTVILSHPDADHVGGLVDVLQSYAVSQVIIPDIEKDTRLYDQFLTEIDQRQIPLQRLMTQTHWQLAEDIEIDILHPSYETYNLSDGPNNASIVFKLTYEDISFLFTGDIEKEIEERLVESMCEELDVDVLKVPHHGSRSSSTPEFLDCISAEIAIIQAGHSNKFGHPHQPVTYRLKKRGVQTFSTHEEGSMRFLSDGEGFYRVESLSRWVEPFIGATEELLYTLN